MVFEWDERKDEANLRKHGLSFKDAKYVFSDPYAVIRDDYTDSEQRHQIMGHIGNTLLTLVVYTMRGINDEEIIRIISARKATSAERLVGHDVTCSPMRP